MNFLLLSLGIGAVPGFISSHVDKPAEEVRIGYVNDAAAPHAGDWFVAAEREQLAGLGYALTDIAAGDYEDAADFAAVLDGVDAVYVAGGNTFALLGALRRRGCDVVLSERVRTGLPYIGSSAGSVITGLSVEPVSLMDDPAEAPGLTDRAGLALVDAVLVPHADGALPPYPPELIARIAQIYGAAYPITFLNDDQALLVEGGSSQVVISR